MLLVSLQNIPVSETIDLAVNGLDLKLSKIQLKELFAVCQFATNRTHFLFNDCFYDQVDGVAIGSHNNKKERFQT